jgi:acyl carrier protein
MLMRCRSEAVLPSTFDIVADIIVQSCHIRRETITEDTHLLTDLGIDSLDFLDVVSAVDDAFGIRVPVEQWLHAVHMDVAPAGQHFVMRELCASIDALIAAPAA